MFKRLERDSDRSLNSIPTFVWQQKTFSGRKVPHGQRFYTLLLRLEQRPAPPLLADVVNDEREYEWQSNGAVEVLQHSADTTSERRRRGVPEETILNELIYE